MNVSGLAVWLLTVGVFLSGILIDPRDPDRVTKLVLADAFLVSGAALYLFGATNRQGVLIIPLSGRTQQLAAILAAFLIWLFVSAMIATLFHGADLRVSVQTLSNYLYGGVIFVIVAAVASSAKGIERLTNAYLLGVLLVSGISVLAMFGIGPDWAHHGAGRIKSTTQSVNQLAAQVAPAVPLALVLCIRRTTTWPAIALYLFVAGLSVLALVATGSRTALALAILSAVPVCVAFTVFYRQKVTMAAGGAQVVFAALLGLIYLASVYVRQGVAGLPDPFKILARPFEMVLNETAAIKGLAPRLDQTLIVWRNWFETPIFGVGPGNFKQYFSYYHEVHNSYFATLIEGGVPALVLLLSFILLMLYRVYTGALTNRLNARSVLLFATGTAFLTVAIYGFGSFGLRQRPFWILAGLAAGAVNLTSCRSRDKP